MHAPNPVSPFSWCFCTVSQTLKPPLLLPLHWYHFYVTFLLPLRTRRKCPGHHQGVCSTSRVFGTNCLSMFLWKVKRVLLEQSWFERTKINLKKSPTISKSLLHSMCWTVQILLRFETWILHNRRQSTVNVGSLGLVFHKSLPVVSSNDFEIIFTRICPEVPFFIHFYVLWRTQVWTWRRCWSGAGTAPFWCRASTASSASVRSWLRGSPPRSSPRKSTSAPTRQPVLRTPPTSRTLQTPAGAETTSSEENPTFSSRI